MLEEAALVFLELGGLLFFALHVALHLDALDFELAFFGDHACDGVFAGFKHVLLLLVELIELGYFLGVSGGLVCVGLAVGLQDDYGRRLLLGKDVGGLGVVGGELLELDFGLFLRLDDDFFQLRSPGLL